MSRPWTKSKARPGAASSATERRSRLAFGLTAALFVVVLLGGGASRTDVTSLLYLRPLTALILAILLVMARAEDLARVRIPLILLGAFAALMALQLVPLPPELWLALPGHARFAEAATIAGIAQPWRPLTLTPDLAWSSLLALVPAFAALIAMGIMRDQHRNATVVLLIGGTLASILVAILQITGGATSPAYLYAITHEGSAVGLFSNRNHQAVFLDAAFVLLRVWSLNPSKSNEKGKVRNWIAIAFAILLVPLIFVTGSRAGLALALVALVLAALVEPWSLLRARAGANTTKYRLGYGAVATAIVAVLMYMVLFSTRSEALRRLTDLDLLESEQRIRNSGLVMRIIGEFMPLGAGFGSFDKVFRIYEPDAWLGPTYFNRAHNDLLELAFTGGLPALVLLGLLLAWLAMRAVVLVPRDPNAGQTLRRARGGWAIMVLILLASLVDYPLRTPLMTTVFAMMAGWVAVHQTSGKGRVTRSARIEGARPG